MSTFTNSCRGYVTREITGPGALLKQRLPHTFEYHQDGMQMYLHNDKHRFIKQPLMTLDPITRHQDFCTEAGAAAALWQRGLEQSVVRFKCNTHRFCFYSKIKARLNKNKGQMYF